MTTTPIFLTDENGKLHTYSVTHHPKRPAADATEIAVAAIAETDRLPPGGILKVC